MELIKNIVKATGKALAAGLVGLALIGATPAGAANSWEPLPLETVASFGYTHVMHLYATNCSALSSNVAANMFPVFNSTAVTAAAGTRVTGCAVRVTTPWGGGPMTACTVKLGDVTNPGSLLPATGIGTNITAGTWTLGTNTLHYVFNTATNLVLTLAPSAAGNGLLTNLVNGTGTGQIDIYLRVHNLNDLNNN